MEPGEQARASALDMAEVALATPVVRRLVRRYWLQGTLELELSSPFAESISYASHWVRLLPGVVCSGAP